MAYYGKSSISVFQRIFTSTDKIFIYLFMYFNYLFIYLFIFWGGAGGWALRNDHMKF